MHTILYSFQVYIEHSDSIFIYITTLPVISYSDHNKPKNHLSLYTVITILLTIFPVLYIPSL